MSPCDGIETTLKTILSNKYRTKPVSNLLRAEATGIYIQILKTSSFGDNTPKSRSFSDNDAEGTKRQSDVNSDNQRLFVYPFIDKSGHPCKTPPAIVRTMVEIICICINLSFSSESSLLSFKYRTSHRHGTKMNIAISATVITSSTGTSCKPPSKNVNCVFLINRNHHLYYIR